MTAKEELERIIIEWWSVAQFTILAGYSAKRIKELTQAILGAKFVRLEDVEIDKQKLADFLDKNGCGHNWHYRDFFEGLAIAIATKAKGIIKVKEGK